ncbi:MAG: cytochrome B [Candidatus Vogelbacteria bacterium CG10_big_fil_rev_8_21_14_0_10_51_16]|uniref:Cytochrome B n=1 Tax=Candidatus Vogelbacteria bacterium CG10_big_fil_rev_8_21_14_0_10_51_16 TaxID=1975045 RepID=A0A2H0REU8_9BACT|nr:MAG: cytochrome B [Candidatus Vogelbacteria bacterium CG10_big_fil_rev_8_21_14_0_10_51_16]
MLLLNKLRDRLVSWVTRYADHEHGERYLAIVSFIEAIFFPIPPDPLILPLATKQPMRWRQIALTTALASVLGGVIGYGIGAVAFGALGAPLLEWYGKTEAFEALGVAFNDNVFITIFLAGFTPIPFKVFTLAAGFFHVNFLLFVVAALISRGLRFAIVAWVGARYGELIGSLLYKYFNMATALTAVLVLAYLLLH